MTSTKIDRIRRVLYLAFLLITPVALAQSDESTSSAQAKRSPETPASDGVNAYQRRETQGPTGCNGCRPVMPASEQPNEEPGLPQAVPQHGAAYLAQREAAHPQLPNPLPYDLLLKNGHVIDVKNSIDRVLDVAIKDGKIAAVGEHLNEGDAAKSIDVTGYLVTPGLIDIHTHDYASTGEFHSYAGDYGIYPDGFTLRNGVTTICDAGSSGWRNFEDFKEHIIDRSQTRVLAFLNIVGAGMRGPRFENNIDDMQRIPTAFMALRYPETIVGIKSAHFIGPEWQPYIEAVGAGNIAHIPVMIDYGEDRQERPLYDLLATHLRAGDIYTHAYSGIRDEQDAETLGPSQALLTGRKRRIYFDAGTGAGSFRFRVAVPLIKAGFLPDSLSTDLHTDSMNSNTKDLLNVMSKFMAMGLTLQQVIADTTWNPAQEIHRPQFGNLSVGAPADLAVLSEEHGNFGFLDMDNLKLIGHDRLICELTLRDGKIVYDLDGISMDIWNDPHPSTDPQKASHWTTFIPAPALRDQLPPPDRSSHPAASQ